MPAGPRQIMCDHPAPPDVLRADPVAMPELQRNQGSAHLLARKQTEVRQLLPRRDAHDSLFVARKPGVPLPRPAQAGNDPFARPLQIEITKIAIRGTASDRRVSFPRGPAATAVAKGWKSVGELGLPFEW